MEYTELGSTGVDVSVMSLGAGGDSKLGLNRGKEESEARRVVERAVDLGVNLIDTAETYGTEEVVGNAIEDESREELVLSTKFSLYDDDELRSPDDLEASLEQSLKRLGTEYVDIYHLHGVTLDEYEHAAEELYPRMKQLEEEGKIRFAGITESVSSDPSHNMLAQAVDDGLWDVIMVGFNLLNHSARRRVLKPATEQGIGTIGMVAVRNALSNPAALEEAIDELVTMGEVDPTEVDPRDAFGFLVHEGGADDVIDAAYRFARHQPTIDTVLTGTASPEHLEANVESALRGPLPEADLERLEARFGDVRSIIGN